ncbi:MAG: hypothetical protein IT291_10055 [Deltaproteobacteria bacterium]|nr:hypothetical protein [Deltaproteobacteria bacterium]
MRLNSYKFPIVKCFLAILLVFDIAVAEPSSKTKQVKEGKEKSAKVDAKQYSTDLFYGKLTFIHPENISIIVEPIDGTPKRRIIYLDEKTMYMDGKKTVTLSFLQIGQRIAVRSVSENGFHLADRVFIVQGEFKPDEFLKIRR